MGSLDNEWDELPIAELHQFDALCDRFEQALMQDSETCIEAFIAELPPDQQHLCVRELVPIEVEQRWTSGAAPSPNEFASRFPQWAEELETLATSCLNELEETRLANTETIDNAARAEKTAVQRKAESGQWREEWRTSSSSAGVSNLPTDGVLGNYQLLSVIGRGGMGLVVRAHDTQLTRDVAIKILTPTIPADRNANERFLREARAGAVIRHNHVVTIHAVEEIDRIPFMVMELVEGTTLDKQLRQEGALPPQEVADLSLQIAEGLAAAHQQGLVHQDITPANILLEDVATRAGGDQSSSNWHARITDFGLARAVAELQLNNSNVVAGTPQYMSPEQAHGQEIDARSDLFSLGSVMYAMCAGTAPFHADSTNAILLQVAEGHARSLHEISPQTPDWLIEIVEQLMARSPEARFQSANEVAEQLSARVRKWQAGPTAPALQSSLRGTIQNGAGSRLVGLGFAAMLAVVAGAVFLLSTKNGGTIRFEVNDPEIRVSFAGETVNIVDGDNEYRFAAGDHELSVQYGDLAFNTKEFTLGKGEDVRLRVTYLEKRLVVERDGELLWTERNLETRVAVSDGTLTVTGRNAVASADDLSISFSDGAYAITDSGGVTFDASSIGGSTGNGTNSVTIPKGSINTVKIVTLAGNDTVTVNSLRSGDSIQVNGGDGTDVLIWKNTNRVVTADLTADAIFINSLIDSAGGNVSVTSNAGVNLADAGITLGTANSGISTSGPGTVSMTTTRDITMSDGARITTENGNIILSANRQATQSSGDFHGVLLHDSLIQATGSGAIVIKGRGGVGTGAFVGRSGVTGLDSTIRSNTGSITVDGIGGTNTGAQNNGVQVHRRSFVESTSGGCIDITGVAGSTGFGVRVLYDGKVRTSGMGAITVRGTGGRSAHPVNYNSGVSIDLGTIGSGAAVTNSGSGPITILAFAGPNSPAFFMGRDGTNRVGFDGTNEYSGDILIYADSYDISDATIQTDGTVTLQPTTSGLLNDLEAADAASKLGLSDAELEQISAGSLHIGNPDRPPTP